jgi:hypothetical protein
MRKQLIPRATTGRGLLPRALSVIGLCPPPRALCVSGLCLLLALGSRDAAAQDVKDPSGTTAGKAKADAARPNSAPTAKGQVEGANKLPSTSQSPAPTPRQANKRPPAAPTGQQPAAPTGQQPAAPTGQQPAAPTGQQPAAPTGQQPAAARATTTIPSKAALRKLRTVLLPIEGDASIRSLGLELAQAFAHIQQPLEQAGLSIGDLVLAVGCSGRSVACLQRIGAAVGAEALILARVARAGDGLRLDLRWFHVPSGIDRGSSHAALTLDPLGRVGPMRRAVRDLLGLQREKQPQRPQGGTLVVTSPVKQVEVEVNGQVRGIAPLTLTQLPPGRYVIAGRRVGFVPWRGEAAVEAGREARVVLMVAKGARALKERKGYFASIGIHTWVVAAGGAAALITAAGFGAHLASSQREFDEIRGVSPEQIARMQELKDSGVRAAKLANSFAAVGGGLVLVAGVLSCLDYVFARPEESAPRLGSSRSVLRWVRVGPTSATLLLQF